MNVFLHLAAIEWAALGWLGASAAVVVPIVLHLRGRIAGPTVRFGAMRFVRDARVALVRRTRLRDLLLLLARCAIIVFLAATFARPSWTARPEAAVASIANATDVVIVWDVSASMSCSGRDGGPLHDTARRDVINILESLDPSTHRAGVILAGARPSLVLPELSFNHDALIARVRAIEPTLEHADLVGAVRRAMAMSADVAVHVVCDNQHTQLASLIREWPDAATRPFTIHALSHRDSNFNVAVHDPVQFPLETEIGDAWSLDVSVSRSGNASDAASVVATLVVDDQELRREVQFDSATDRGVIHFEHRFAEAGVFPFEVRIVGDDALAADNQISGHAYVRATRRVGVISDRDPAATVAQYLMYAIAPDDNAPWSWTWLDTTRLDPAGLEQELGRFDTVALIDATMPTNEHLSVVYRFAEAGGGVMWWLDHAATSDTLNRFEQLDQSRTLSPVSVTQRIQPELRRWVETGASISLLPGFDTLSTTAIRAIQVAVSDSLQSNPHAQTLITDDRGEPAIVWAPLGRGRVVVCHGSFDPALGATLIRQPAFPALVQGMMRFLLPDPLDAPVYAVGELPKAQSPGARIELRPESGPVSTLAARATIQVDPRESNLGVGSIMDEAGTFATQSNIDERMRQVATMAPALPRAVPLWPWCLLACLVFFVMETILVARRSRRGVMREDASA